MDQATQIFSGLRPRLQRMAYRMLGSAAEAEDLVQDAWLRWHGTRPEELNSPEAWLVTMTTRMAIDRLRSSKAQRENYIGFWLPEPVLDEAAASPEHELEQVGEVSVAFLHLLELLAPETRAAFLLREVFDADYADIAQTLDKSEAACRQLVSRAKTALRGASHRRSVPRAVHGQLLSSFARAASSGRIDDIRALIAEDAQLLSDGGGKVPSFGKALQGSDRLAQLYLATHLRHGTQMQLVLVQMNGEPGLLRFIDGQLESAQSFVTDGTRIVQVLVLVQRNPDKLAAIARAWARQAAAAAPVTSGPAETS